MFKTVDRFLASWQFEASSTKKVLEQLTDESLSQQITAENWTLGRIAWHITAAIKLMASQAGIDFDAPAEDYPVPDSAEFILKSYEKASNAFMQAVKSQLINENLDEEIDFFGNRMTKGTLLLLIIQHQIHHRGQMTVLMRQAGLQVPGIYGPSKDEWSQIGMDAPKM